MADESQPIDEQEIRGATAEAEPAEFAVLRALITRRARKEEA